MLSNTYLGSPRSRTLSLWSLRLPLVATLDQREAGRSRSASLAPTWEARVPLVGTSKINSTLAFAFTSLPFGPTTSSLPKAKSLQALKGLLAQDDFVVPKGRRNFKQVVVISFGKLRKKTKLCKKTISFGLRSTEGKTARSNFVQPSVATRDRRENTSKSRIDIQPSSFKNIMAKTQTTDFFIACKESRIENKTSFYGSFYLGPFDDNLTQTLANDLRRTLLSELTGLSITCIEIEGVLHKFSNLPGMKESVLDLICNIQNIVLKKQYVFSSNNSTGESLPSWPLVATLDQREDSALAFGKALQRSSSPQASAQITLQPTKKTFVGFLNVSGPRIIKASDLKLPAGLLCVDPNQYIATLAEDGFLNMKFNINEGKNFIKQQPYNLDVNTLKKRNILLQNFKKTNLIYQTSSRVKANFPGPISFGKRSKSTEGKTKINFKSSEASFLAKLTEGKTARSNFVQPSVERSYQREDDKQRLKTQKTLPISNPIPLDAVFMPITKMNSIIEENNLYSDFTTDPVNFSLRVFPSVDRRFTSCSEGDRTNPFDTSNKLGAKIVRSLPTQPKLRDQSVESSCEAYQREDEKNMLLKPNSYYNFSTFLNFINYNLIYQTSSLLPITQGQSSSTFYVDPGYSVLNAGAPSSEGEESVAKPLPEAKAEGKTKLIPWQSNSLYFDLNFDSPGSTLAKSNTFLPSSTAKSTYQKTAKNKISNTIPFGNRSESKIKTFLSPKTLTLETLSLWSTNGRRDREEQPLFTGGRTKAKAIFAFSPLKPRLDENVNTVKTILQKNVLLNEVNLAKKPKGRLNEVNPTTKLLPKGRLNEVNSLLPEQKRNQAKELVNENNLNLEYKNNLKLKPLRKKSHLIVEIWTNGSIHPRQALYHAFSFLANNFLKLQTVKMLGAMFNSELAYGNLKYSVLNNYKNKPIQISALQLLSGNPDKSLNNREVKQNYVDASINAPIGILNISLRSYTALKKTGILTIKDLINISKKDLLKIKNFGPKALFAIETNLLTLGLTLKN